MKKTLGMLVLLCSVMHASALTQPSKLQLDQKQRAGSGLGSDDSSSSDLTELIIMTKEEMKIANMIDQLTTAPCSGHFDGVSNPKPASCYSPSMLDFLKIKFKGLFEAQHEYNSVAYLRARFLGIPIELQKVAIIASRELEAPLEGDVYQEESSFEQSYKAHKNVWYNDQQKLKRRGKPHSLKEYADWQKCLLAIPAYTRSMPEQVKRKRDDDADSQSKVAAVWYDPETRPNLGDSELTVGSRNKDTDDWVQGQTMIEGLPLKRYKDEG